MTTKVAGTCQIWQWTSFREALEMCHKNFIHMLLCWYLPHEVQIEAIIRRQTSETTKPCCINSFCYIYFSNLWLKDPFSPYLYNLQWLTDISKSFKLSWYISETQLPPFILYTVLNYKGRHSHSRSTEVC